MKRRTAIIAIVLAAGGLSACGGREAAPPERVRGAIDVIAVPAATLETAERLDAGGIVTAQETATLSSRLVATIASVRVTAGDRVRAGDVLVTLDARDLIGHTQQLRAGALAAEKSLAQSRTDQRAAEADHRLAAASHARIAALHARNSATDQERDEADARLAAATARVAGAQAAVEAADATLVSARASAEAATATESYATVRAPFAGLITERLTDPGNLATPGVPLLRIESDGARQVIVRVDEARAAYVHTADRVEVEIDRAGESTAGWKPIEGVVAEVARAVGADQRAFTVKVNIPRTVTARSGTFARVIFTGSSRRALFVPVEAIRRHGQVSSVYVVQDGVTRLRLIQAGPSSAAGAEILAGLDAGELVVVSSAAGLADGTRVTVSATRSTAGGTP
jgi:RND family efflux transporter MFP subunit